MLPALHAPFNFTGEHPAASTSNAGPGFSTTGSLAALTTLLLNTDPSPNLISSLISPIITPLYNLRSYLLEHPGVVLIEPNSKNIVDGLVKTWARVVIADEVIKGWWSVVKGADGWGLVDWQTRQIDEEDGGGIWVEWAVVDGEPVVRAGRYVSTSLVSDV